MGKQASIIKLCEGIPEKPFCRNQRSQKPLRLENGKLLCGECIKLLTAKMLEDRALRKRNLYKTYTVYAKINPRFKRRKQLNKWQFLTKKAEELRNHPTESEIVFERKLKELDLGYTFQWQFLHEGIGGICDFYIHSCLLCIEIDGGYHLDQDQQQTDRVKDFIYKCLHKKVLRLTNQQALYLSIGQIKILIEAVSVRL